MAKLHLASPREITSPFTHEIISVLYSKACNNLYILHTLYYTLHTEHAYCLSYRFLNNEMVEMVEILDGRLGQR